MTEYRVWRHGVDFCLCCGRSGHVKYLYNGRECIAPCPTALRAVAGALFGWLP